MIFNLYKEYANCTVGEGTYGRNSKSNSTNYPGKIRASLTVHMASRFLPRILGQPAHELARRDCLRAGEEGPDGPRSSQSSKRLHCDGDGNSN